MKCLVCMLPTQSMWKKRPVCAECRELGKQLMSEQPHMSMRDALITISEWIRGVLKQQIKKQITTVTEVGELDGEGIN